MKLLAALILTTIIGSLGVVVMVYGWGLHPISWPIVILGYAVVGLISALGAINHE